MIVPKIDERPVLELALPANLSSGEVEKILITVLREQERIRQARLIRNDPHLTLDKLTRAVHGLRHEKGDLWPVTPGCGCEDFALALRDRLEE